MNYTYTKNSDGTITLVMNINVTGDLMAQETALQVGLQAAGQLAMAELLKELDTNGSAIVIENERYTSRGLEKKNIKPSSEQ